MHADDATGSTVPVGRPASPSTPDLTGPAQTTSVTETTSPVGTTGPAPVPGPPTPTRLLRGAIRWESGLAVLFIAVLILGRMVSGDFLTSTSVFNMGLSYGEIAIMTLPMTLIVISGEIDLSVASTLGMASAILGILWSDHWPMLAIFAVVLVAGALAGLFNGLLVTRLGLPSLAVTIGTLALYRGIALIILGSKSISNFPVVYTDVGVNTIPGTGGLTYSTGIFVVLAVIFAGVLHFSPAGRAIYAMGSSPDAARFAGIRVKRIKTLLFVASGVICSLAGVLYTFRLSTAVQDNGLGLELSVVAIVLLGGVSIFGGRGTLVGVVLAVAVYASIQYVLLLTNFNQEATGLVTGAILLASVFVPNAASFAARLRTRLRARRPAPR